MIRFKKKKKNEVNLIPMINIIFLLLIFFMLTGTIQSQKVPKVNNPSSIFASEVDPYKKNIIKITITKYGRFFINNEEKSLPLLMNELSKKKEKKIFLNIDKESTIKDLNKLINILKKENFKNIFIRTIDNNDK